MILNRIVSTGFLGRVIIPFVLVSIIFLLNPKGQIPEEILANPFLQDLFSRMPMIWKKVLVLAMLLLDLILLGFLAENIKLERKRPYLLPVSFLVLVLALNRYLFDPAILFLTAITIVSYISLFKDHLTFSNTRSYNSGLLIGLGVLIFPPFSIFLLLYSFFLLSYNQFDIRKLIIYLLGALSPLYFLFCYQYLIQQSINLDFLWRWQYGFEPLTINKSLGSIALILAIFLTTFGLVLSPSMLGFLTVNARRSLNALYFLCLSLLILSGVYQFPAFPLLSFSLPIFAVFISIPVTELKRGKVVYEIALIICFGFSVFNLCF